jgi:hypothetical protein
MMARPPDVLVAPPGLLPRPAASPLSTVTESSQITRTQQGRKPRSSTLLRRCGRTPCSHGLHLVPLELGGAVNDPRNLWPEPGASPNPKDAVEDDLRAKVCDGQMTLAQAQRAITTNWVALAPPPSSQAPSSNTSTSSTAPASASSAAGAQCSVNASYDDRYHDYDVYVHSNEPDATVTVTDAAGRTATWHTDSSGYADVYFHASAAAPGETITAHVGGASGHATL